MGTARDGRENDYVEETLKLAVITACLYPDRQRIHYLEESCEKQGIFLIPHGIGKQFAGWANALMTATIPAMKDLNKEGYTHVLFTDGSDSIIVSSLDEIIGSYLCLGKPPCLMSADSECYPAMNGDKFIEDCRYKYVNGGGYITEIPYFVDLMTRLAQKYGDIDGNHQSWIVQEWAIEGLVTDCNCEIFQPMDLGDWPIVGKRLLNPFTHTYPSVLHFRGGYSDPETGRDFRIEPVWRQLYGNGEGMHARERSAQVVREKND